MRFASRFRGENGYDLLLKDVSSSFEEDFWVEPYKKFVKSDHNLFWEEKMGNGGFNAMFWDFHEKCLKEWYAIQHNEDESLENDDVLGEKLIYRDLMANKADDLKNIRIPKNPRLFFKHLSEEEMQKVEDKLGIKKKEH
jgi:hypothetical protein